MIKIQEDVFFRAKQTATLNFVACSFYNQKMLQKFIKLFSKLLTYASNYQTKNKNNDVENG